MILPNFSPTFFAFSYKMYVFSALLALFKLKKSSFCKEMSNFVGKTHIKYDKHEKNIDFYAGTALSIAKFLAER